MREQKVTWFAMVASTFTYAVIVWMLAPNTQGTFSEAVQRHQLTLILYGVALMTFVLANVVPKTALRNAPPRTRMVVTMAMYEACALYGLVAAFLGQDWRLYIPTWALALIGMLRAYPSSEAPAPA